MVFPQTHHHEGQASAVFGHGQWSGRNLNSGLVNSRIWLKYMNWTEIVSIFQIFYFYPFVVMH